MKKYRTGISQAYWCMLSQDGARYQPASIKLGDEVSKNLFEKVVTWQDGEA
jgi:hypothetical protein